MKLISKNPIHGKIILPISDVHSQYALVLGILGHNIRTQCPDLCPDFITISGDLFEAGTMEYTFIQFVKACDNINTNAKIVIVSGNHDYLDYSDIIKRYELGDRVFHLFNECKTIDGVTFYGCPHTTPFMNWNYMMDDKRIGDILFNTMCDVGIGKIDVALFHSPPRGFGDEVGDERDNVGSETVLEALLHFKPRFAFWGHIHCGNKKVLKIGKNTIGKNVSVMDGSNSISKKTIESLEMFRI